MIYDKNELGIPSHTGKTQLNNYTKKHNLTNLYGNLRKVMRVSQSCSYIEPKILQGKDILHSRNLT